MVTNELVIVTVLFFFFFVCHFETWNNRDFRSVRMSCMCTVWSHSRPFRFPKHKANRFCTPYLELGKIAWKCRPHEWHDRESDQVIYIYCSYISFDLKHFDQSTRSFFFDFASNHLESFSSLTFLIWAIRNNTPLNFWYLSDIPSERHAIWIIIIN